VENLVDFLRTRNDDQRLTQAPTNASAPGFNEARDNSEDADYDLLQAALANARLGLRGHRARAVSLQRPIRRQETARDHHLPHDRSGSQSSSGAHAVMRLTHAASQDSKTQLALHGKEL